LAPETERHEVAMPIYEYRCSACGKELEALQKLSDPPLTACPACHAETLVKLVSAAGFQLKGSGWYATDFKGSGKPAAKKDGGDSAAESKADGKGEGASESKTEAKTESKSDSKAESKSDSKTEAKSTTTKPSSGSGTPPAST
jgi:putative FmdB family regulatory protein